MAFLLVERYLLHDNHFLGWKEAAQPWVKAEETLPAPQQLCSPRESAPITSTSIHSGLSCCFGQDLESEETTPDCSRKNTG